MKHFIPGTLLLAVILFLAACKKDEPLPPAEPQHLIELGKVACNIGDKQVESSATLFFSDFGYFQIATPNKFAYAPNIDESLIISHIPLLVGKHKIHIFDYLAYQEAKSFALLDWTIEIDQPVGDLQTTGDYSDDFIEVVRLDTINKVVEGRFQFHLKNMDTDNPHLATFKLPSEMYVSEGVFHLKVD